MQYLCTCITSHIKPFEILKNTMSQLEPLIADLALILICAGVMTLLFKSLKQPIVLGYIVAGFLASPNMPYMPSVTDMHGIHLWSEIGVIFLLFALGLEFSFKKILKMGAAPIIAAISIILGMMNAQKMTLSDELFRTAELLRFFGGMIEGQDSEPSLERVYSGETYAQVALRYLNDNYMYKISIADLASTIGVERSYLSRVFLQEYHESPQKYLLKLRLERACGLLENSSLSIAEIASRVGYDDYSSFTKIFRQKMGMSPTEYRNAAADIQAGT